MLSATQAAQNAQTASDIHQDDWTRKVLIEQHPISNLPKKFQLSKVAQLMH